jgi:putative tricarboxylic transport membrane protein
VDMWFQAFQLALSGSNLLFLILGTIFGLVLGVLPAIGGALGLALVLPFTYQMDPATAVILIMAIHASSAYGDSVTSILVNVPGGPGTVASCWDGYPMTRQGRPGRALGIATFGSLVGGMIGWLCLVLLIGPIMAIAMQIGPPEYFALGIMALMLISVASKGETVKGIIMACLGLIFATVGQDPVTGFANRFNFGMIWLEDKIPVVVSTLGVFAMSQMIVLMNQGTGMVGDVDVKDNPLAGLWEILKRPLTVLRAGAIGIFVGIAPALGTSVAGIASYLVEKQFSKDRQQFGKGAAAGLVAAEVGKGTCVVGDMIPTFLLGVPGSVAGALVMVALMIQGVDAGPKFMSSGILPYVVFAGILSAQAAYVLGGLVTLRWLVKIAYIPTALLAASLTVLCFLGAFVERDSTFDIIILVAFGIAAFFFERMGYPTVCLILGLILGPLVESNLYRALVMGGATNSWMIFVTRPIAATLLGIVILSMGIPFLVDFMKSRKIEWLPVQEGTDNEVKKEKDADGSLPELVFLVILVTGWSIMLYVAKDYGPGARLFPVTMLVFGLAVVGLRLLGLIVTRAYRRGSLRLSKASFLPANGCIPWPLAILLLIGVVLLTYVIGFVPACAIYLIGVPWLMNFRPLKVSLAVALGTVLVIIFGANFFGIYLPIGLVGQFASALFF